LREVNVEAARSDKALSQERKQEEDIMASATLSEANIEPFARQYAQDVNEPFTIVQTALTRLLRSDPNLACHPVMSGDLQREIAAIRTERTRRHARSALSA
jgi:hypothetical protein